MLDYLERTLSKKDRRRVGEYMAQYNNMDAVIESKRIELMPSKVSAVKENPVQESGTNDSEADKYLRKSMVINQMIIDKKRLDIVYNRAKPLHKLIWDEHFVDGRMDADIYYGNDITKRTYYREKNEIMLVVAECLEIGTNLHHNRTKLML